MAHRRSGFAKKIDTVHWTGLFEVTTGLAAGTVAVNALLAQHLPETLLRIRGEWAAAFSTQLADGTGISITAGLIQVPEGTATTVLWSPLTDSDAPWIWWDTFNLIYGEAVVDVIASQNTLSRARVIDSKAMRKLRNTELQWVVENATLGAMAAGAANVAIGARVLSGS